MINYYTVWEYKNLFKKYISAESSEYRIFLIFEVKREIDEQGLKNASELYTLCNSIISVYQDGLDDEKFDKTVKDFARFFKENIKKTGSECYGIIVSHYIDVMPKFSNETKSVIKNFQIKINKILSKEENYDWIESNKLDR